MGGESQDFDGAGLLKGLDWKDFYSLAFQRSCEWGRNPVQDTEIHGHCGPIYMDRLIGPCVLWLANVEGHAPMNCKISSSDSRIGTCNIQATVIFRSHTRVVRIPSSPSSNQAMSHDTTAIAQRLTKPAMPFNVSRSVFSEQTPPYTKTASQRQSRFGARAGRLRSCCALFALDEDRA